MAGIKVVSEPLGLALSAPPAIHSTPPLFLLLPPLFSCPSPLSTPKSPSVAPMNSGRHSPPPDSNWPWAGSPLCFEDYRIRINLISMNLHAPVARQYACTPTLAGAGVTPGSLAPPTDVMLRNQWCLLWPLATACGPKASTLFQPHALEIGWHGCPRMPAQQPTLSGKRRCGGTRAGEWPQM